MSRALPGAALAAALLCLAACSTLETAADHARNFAHSHPVLTAVAVGVAVGSIASHHHHHHDHRYLYPPGSCEAFYQGQGLDPVTSCR